MPGRSELLTPFGELDGLLAAGGGGGGDYLLAMKLRASRDRDLDDAVVLARETGRTTRESLYELITDGYRRGTVIPDLEAFVAQDGAGSAGLDV